MSHLGLFDVLKIIISQIVTTINSELESKEQMVKQINGGYYVKNCAKKNPYWDSEKEDDELVWIDDAVILEAESKKTGKKEQKRCYQGVGAIDDFQDAIDGKSSRFSDVLKKIDG